MLAYCDETRESMAGMLRPGNAGANTAIDQIHVAEAALEQIPQEHIQDIEILLRVDSAGASHELLKWAHEANIRFSVGYDLTESVRAAVLEIADEGWSARWIKTVPSAPTARSPSSPTWTLGRGRRGRA